MKMSAFLMTRRPENVKSKKGILMLPLSCVFLLTLKIFEFSLFLLAGGFQNSHFHLLFKISFVPLKGKAKFRMTPYKYVQPRQLLWNRYEVLATNLKVILGDAN